MSNYEYCDVCHRNFMTNTKHTYTRKHIKLRDVSLNKFLLKVKNAKTMVTDPQIRDNKLDEPIRQFWCLFCSVECSRDERIRPLLTAIDSFLLLHIAGDDHSTNVGKFLHVNHLPPTLRGQYISTIDDYCAYSKARSNSLISNDSSRSKRLHLVANKFEKDCKRSKYIINHVVKNMSDIRCITKSTDSVPCSSGYLPIQESQLKHQILKADPHNSIGQKIVEKTIGPTMDDLMQFKKDEFTRKLPENRLGANYDRNAPYDPLSWFPEFHRKYNKKSK